MDFSRSSGYAPHHHGVLMIIQHRRPPRNAGEVSMAITDRIPYQAQIDRPRLVLPDGKKLAVWVILNVEEWRIESAMPRTVLSPPMGQPLLPDVPNWSWHEYGM